MGWDLKFRACIQVLVKFMDQLGFEIPMHVMILCFHLNSSWMHDLRLFYAQIIVEMDGFSKFY